MLSDDVNVGPPSRRQRSPMKQRFLHVLESLAPGGMETTFLNMLRAFRDIDPSIEHHVLSFAGGSLEPRYRDAAGRVTIACDTETIDAHVGAGYDLVHVLFERCAYRVLPRLVAVMPSLWSMARGTTWAACIASTRA